MGERLTPRSEAGRDVRTDDYLRSRLLDLDVRLGAKLIAYAK